MTKKTVQLELYTKSAETNKQIMMTELILKNRCSIVSCLRVDKGSKTLEHKSYVNVSSGKSSATAKHMDSEKSRVILNFNNQNLFFVH